MMGNQEKRERFYINKDIDSWTDTSIMTYRDEIDASYDINDTLSALDKIKEHLASIDDYEFSDAEEITLLLKRSLETCEEGSRRAKRCINDKIEALNLEYRASFLD